MTWYRFRAQGARNTAGAVVTSGLGRVYPVTDPNGTGTSAPTRVAVPGDDEEAKLGTGAVLTNVTVADALTVEFDADLPSPHCYWKSGAAPSVYLISATGFLKATQAAQAAAASSATAAAQTRSESQAALVTAAADLGVVTGRVNALTTMVIETVTTTTYTVTADDVSIPNRAIHMSNAAANTITIPSTLPTGSAFVVRQTGAGQTTIAGGSGTTGRSTGGAFKLAAQYASASVLIGTGGEFFVDGYVIA